VTQDGLYYTSYRDGAFRSIRYHDWATGTAIDVWPTVGLRSGLTVSPDQTRLWYAALHDVGSDLTMFEFAPID
jgi:hypothetical protein